MFRVHSGLLAILAVSLAACGSGEIGDQAARFGGPGDPADPGDPGNVPNPDDPFPNDDPTCPDAAAVVVANDGWSSVTPSEPAFSGLRLSLMARPEEAALNALVAVGGQDIEDFADAAVLVRFADDGLIDARDGSAYDADIDFTYEPGVWYSIDILADIETETYDVEISRCGEEPKKLITSASFRADAGVSDRLTAWAAWSSQTATLELATPSWFASGSCVPATCDSLGLECGSPSDGCGGTLSCGGCAGSATCQTGICVAHALPPQDPPQDDPPSDPPPPPGDRPERPWAHNTGPTNPGALRPSGSITVETDGTVIEDVDITGSIVVEASNVTIRNFRINSNGGAYGINIRGGNKEILIEDGEITNARSAPILTYSPIVARRLHIHTNGADGMKIQGSGSLIESSFIEKLGMNDRAHADGNQSRGVKNVTFRYNNFYMPHPGTPEYPGAPFKSNATIFLETPSGSSTNNILIDGNWLNGGAYTIFCSDSSTNVKVINNFFGRYNAGWPDKVRARIRTGNCDTWVNNRWEDTGELIE